MRQCALRKLRPLRLSNAPSPELRSSYATQGLLDHFLGRRNDSGPGVTAVVGARRNRSDRLPLLVGGVPQRLVLIQVSGLQISRMAQQHDITTDVTAREQQLLSLGRPSKIEDPTGREFGNCFGSTNFTRDQLDPSAVSTAQLRSST